ncbi:HAD-IIB family hydrolase [Hydrogenothermus marinus]|uniref:Glucosyl-3-phosphoglycerate phosphatase n=1 Tax=Hydrogenothermus marinus TaxID=133270 RepID=A0A3M0BKS8_9AQUI|nr:HAD-IIB family hydrolase [Hydrogenothermus marinus]RMA97757.1 glucosyl-3-phosphoglycerate phosphatase [Hydrogenothermus marinus]
MNLLIFTDLDGTLLNYGDYSFEDAKPALEKIKQNNIPLILTTSKTRKEVEILQKNIGINDPFIVENGAAIFFKKGYKGFKIPNTVSIDDYQVIILGERYEKVREIFNIYKKDYCLKGFGDLTAEEIVKLTNLPLERVKLSKQREFTEPFITDCPEKIEDLKKEVAKHGFKIIEGGRFYHFISQNQDKGKAVEITKKIFEENLKTKIKTIGLGDSKNDIPLLEKVDIPILIKKHDGSYIDINLPNLIKSTYEGSKGWNEVVMPLLEKYLENR